MRDIDDLFQALAKSSFRCRFTLKGTDLDYYSRKGLTTVLSHGRDFLEDRLALAHPSKDGKQTPMRGHPFFLAQHATASCCRNCLRKWQFIPEGTPLTPEHVTYILKVARTWLLRQAPAHHDPQRLLF
jgi:hypothetical protein